MLTRKSYRTTTPFQGGLSPTTPKSTGVPLFGDTPSLQDLSFGQGKGNDLHGRGSWGEGEDVDKSYREQGDDYRIDIKIKDIINRLRSRPKSRKEKWVLEGSDGKEQEFSSQFSLQRYLRQNGLSYNRVRTRVAQNEHIDVIGKASDSTVMIRSISGKSNTMEIGSGFHIGKGLYVTCAHVIKRYNKYEQSSGSILNSDAEILLSRNENEAYGRLVASDLGLDLAIIQSDMESETLTLEIEPLPSGSEVFAVGSPRGYENNISAGIIGSNNREIFDYIGAPTFTFTDANVLPGNSGGPLISYDKGTVVGMMSLIVGAEGLYGLNAALPSKNIYEFLKGNGLL
ncbi:MAG: serine protease [Candidatus Cloacimonetes bacterium]|jgi:S1-C subfamily serine protease|nr:serine protease [Candidatus Cloacimonadota bacterium]